MGLLLERYTILSAINNWDVPMVVGGFLWRFVDGWGVDVCRRVGTALL
jgi:hypothetical protein